jgi:pimeloyl-ACP methyl ester carboxylesterase
MSAIIIDGKLLHYETFGRGKPLIFIHGWLGSWRYWMPAMEILSEFGRTYAMDLWGFGDSDRANGVYSVAEYVRLLDEFIEEMGFGAMTLIGHALGAVVVMRYTAENPDYVERIMAVSAPMTAESVNRKLLAPGSSLFDRVRGWRPSEGHPEVEQEMEKMAQDVVESIVRSTIEADLRRVVKQIQAPILWVHGEKDSVVAPPQPECLVDVGDNVRTIVLPEVRHFPMLEETPKFARLLTDFLAINDREGLAALAVKEEWRRRTH